MKLINLNLFAEGYYSGITYEEDRWIKTESYNKIKNNLPQEIFVGELDGKHSEVYGNIEVQNWTENDEEVAEVYNEKHNGDCLRRTLIYIYNENKLNFYDEEKEIEEYLSSLDRYVDVTVKVKQSKVIELHNFVNKLKGE